MPRHLVFHVLGPLEIERDGSPLPVRGSKLRGLLAVLLFEAGELLTQEMLIDALWGEEPPPTARTALQMHISRLRKLLDGDPSVTLEFRLKGERLTAVMAGREFKLQPYLGSEFKLEGLTGYSVRFLEDAKGAVAEAFLIQPNGLFSLKRKAATP